MPTIEYRIDITGIPHTYVVINNGAGIEQMYGFAPAAAGHLWGTGHIYDESVSQNGGEHAWDFTTGPIQVTPDQYNRVANEINNAIANPPYYSVPQSVSLTDAVNQCANWANHLAEVGGFSGSLPWGANGWNPYGQAESLKSYFPDYGGDPVGGMRWPGNPGTPDNPSGPIVPYGPTGPSGPGSNGGISPTCGRDYGLARNYVPPKKDPLVLDLDGGGITTSAINPLVPIYFDQDGNGILTATGWIGAGEAIVVRDLNGNGVIDSGRELFGDSTVLTHGPNAGQLAANGFAALADLDANASGTADGKFDSNDIATAGNTDVLQFLSGIAIDQIWLRQVSNNLEVSIIGGTDTMTISNWYLGSQNHVEQFKTSDGKTLLDSQVQNLVSAMAAFSPPAAGQITLPANCAAALEPVIVANWQ